MPLVEITLFAARTPEQKLQTARAISDALVDHAGATPESVQVIFREVERVDWLRPDEIAVVARSDAPAQ